jgi:hypothetical protein
METIQYSGLSVVAAHVLCICLTDVKMHHIDTIKFPQLPMIITTEQERKPKLRKDKGLSPNTQ